MVERLKAVRGATTVGRDDAVDIGDATTELLHLMMRRNDIVKSDLVSIIFTATPDLVSDFPAAAARRMGLGDIPLLCARELDVAGSVPMCIRVLIHLYTERDYGSLRHVYLRGASTLRDDLPE
ncbi:MAG: chorismate mutase [Actinobacteria bacterium]|nr:chorismate mutase [Actinomycetota bacterium]